MSDPLALEQAPVSSGEEQIDSTHALHDFADYRDTWRIFRIMAELVEGYNFLSQFHNEVTILGSARFKEDNENYRLAQGLGALLGKHGFTTITGGGPGIMEAANRGAWEAGGESIGLNIQLPFEQRVNPYVKKSIGFFYFFTRKVMLTSPANAFALFPGGYGTMDEFFEVVDLMELGMMPKSPVVLVGSAFWNPLLDFLRDRCCRLGSVDEAHLKSWHVVDTAKEAFSYIKDVKDVQQVCDLSPNNFHCEGNIDWKIFRVMAELVEGFEFVTGLNDAVTILGSRSVILGDRYYDMAYDLGEGLAVNGYTVVTGGMAGLAEAANKGAFEHGGKSLGIGMYVNGKSEINKYLTKSIMFNFPFTRKLIITTPSKAFVFFPGGFGTLHQLFEVLTLIQTKKIPRVPVILFDHAFWQPMNEYIKRTMVHDVKTIGSEDDELYQIVDDVGSAMKIIKDEHRRNS